MHGYVPTEQEHMVVGLRLAELGTKLTVIGLPTLYFLGWAYTEGFWEVFGIDDRLLSYSTQELVAMGFIVLATTSVGVSITIILGAALLILVAALLDVGRFWIVARFRGVWQRVMDWIIAPKASIGVSDENHADAHRITRNTEFLAGVAFDLFVPAALFLVLLMGAIKLANAQAREAANLDVQRIQQHQSVESRWTLAYLTGHPESARILIRCSNAACAVYSGRDVEVISRASVERLIPCSKIDQSDDGAITCGKFFLGSS